MELVDRHVANLRKCYQMEVVKNVVVTIDFHLIEDLVFETHAEEEKYLILKVDVSLVTVQQFLMLL